MIQRLIVIRHGETVDNLRGVAQGWSDSELSPRGQAQVERIAERVARARPDGALLLDSSARDRPRRR